jgi:hypothetical protein
VIVVVTVDSVAHASTRYTNSQDDGRTDRYSCFDRDDL